MLRTLIIATATALIAGNALAFTTDDRTMNQSGSASNYADPDDKSPLPGTLQFGVSGGNNYIDPMGFPNPPSAAAGDPSSSRAPAMSSFDRYNGRQ